MLLCIMYTNDYLGFQNCVYNIVIENVKVHVVEARFSRCTAKK